MSSSATDSGSLGSLSVFSGVFVTEEVDGVEDKGAGDNTMVDV